MDQQIRSGTSLFTIVISAFLVGVLFVMGFEKLIFYGILSFVALVLLNKGYALLPMIVIALKDVVIGNVVFYVLFIGMILTGLIKGMEDKQFSDSVIILSLSISFWTLIALVKAYFRQRIRSY